MLPELRLSRRAARSRRDTGRGVAAAVSLALLVAGCTTEKTDNRGEGPSPRAAESNPAQTPAPIILPTLKLRADLAEGQARWRLVAAVPFGPRRKELGYFFKREKGSLPLLPRSFAVAEDGSFWIADGVKRRVVHFSKRGRFLEEVGGFKLDEFHPRPKDVAVVEDLVHVIEEEDGRATLTTIGSERRRVAKRVMDGSHPVAVNFLLPFAGHLVARIAGYADPPGTGRTGYAELPIKGGLRLLPGLPVDEETWVDVTTVGDRAFEFTTTRGALRAVQPVQVSVFGGSKSKRLSALVGPGIETVFHEAVGMYVAVAPARPSDAERFGGGAWYLRLGAERSPILWERLPEARVHAEEQFRHLAAGPDGRVYLMVPDPEGEKIYVRPE